MSQKTITVGTPGVPASLDLNFGNTEDNFTELYDKDAAQDIVISGKADALTADENYVSDAELVILQATSNTNTGDQDISGIGTNATAIAALGTAADRDAEDTMTDGANLPDGAAIKAYGDANWSGGGSNLEVEDESVSLDAAVTKLNFLGSGVTAVENADHEIDITVAGGAAPVDSVNTYTGAVVLDPDDLDDAATTNKFATAAQLAIVDGIDTDTKLVARISDEVTTWTGEQTFEDLILPAAGVNDTALDLGTGANQINQDTIVDGSTYVRTHNDLTDTLAGNIATNNSKASITIIRGTAAITAVAVPANSVRTAVTETATGATSADVVVGCFDEDVTAITGYGAAGTDGLFVQAWCSTNTVHFALVNRTDAAITPGSALTLNWMVTK